MQLLWENSMNCMIFDCWILRNTKIVDYLKCICAFYFGTQSHGVWFLKMTQQNNCTGFKTSTRKFTSELIHKLNNIRSHHGMTDFIGI